MEQVRSTIQFKHHLLILLLGTLAQVVVAQPSTPRDSAWITNGTVYAIAYQKGIAYIGGDFSYVGPNRPFGAIVNSSTGQTNLSSPKINGSVYAVASDGAGGWYVGGNFTNVGGYTRNNIAHIGANGSVDQNWNPNATHGYNQDVDAIAVSGGVVYVGGRFSNIGGSNRSNIAALDGTTGLATTWNPNVDGMVRTIVVIGAVVYIGGDFSWIGGYSVNGRNRIAALDVSTGSPTSWNPNCNNSVYTITVSGATVYFGGSFTNVGGQVRNYLAAVNASDAALTSWNPNPDNTIRTMMLSGSVLYVGGDLTTIAGQVRNGIAAVNTSSSTVTSWNPNSNGAVRSLAISGSTVFACGDFTSIGNQQRAYVAALDGSTGAATAWVSNALDKGWALSINTTGLFVGGDFRSIGGQYRNHLAAVDAVNGNATAWNPNANGRVWEITPNGSAIFLGGEFTTIGATTRNYIASVDAVSGALNSWNPNPNGIVYAITLSGSVVYVGGDFSSIGGQSRNRIAAIDVLSGNASGWNPNANNWVTAISINSSTVYLGGAFSSIGGTARNYLAAVNATTGALTNWNPNISNYNGLVYSIVLNNGLAYIGGDFTGFGSVTRNHLAAIDLTTASPTGWNPNVNGLVRQVQVNGSTVFVAGDFTNVGGYTRNFFCGIDITTGIPNGFSPIVDNAVYYNEGDAIATAGEATVFAGGNFNTASNGAQNQDYFAQFGTIPPNPVPTITSISPTSGNRLQTSNITVSGTGFISGETSVSFGPDITVNSITVNSSTQMTANISIASPAATGTRDVSASNGTPGGGTGTLSNGFTVNNPAPTLSTISPSTGSRLQTLNLVLTGTNFISAVTSLNPGSNITVNSITVNSSAQLTANITISTAAGTGSRKFYITNTTPGGGTDSSQTFTVNNPAPTVSSISPSSGNRSQSFSVVSTGTNFISNVTTVNLGSDITLNSLTVNSSTQLTANITISSTTATGTRKFVVTNGSPGGGTDSSQTFTVNTGTAVHNVPDQIPTVYSLSQNYPNPFNPSTSIRYGVPSRSMVRLEIFNVLGQQIEELLNAEQEAGYHEVSWRTGIMSGVYFYRIQAVAVDNPQRRFVETKKLLLLR